MILDDLGVPNFEDTKLMSPWTTLAPHVICVSKSCRWVKGLQWFWAFRLKTTGILRSLRSLTPYRCPSVEW